MKNLKRVSFLLLSMTLLFSACTKENVNPIDGELVTDKEFKFIETALSDHYDESTIPISIDFKDKLLYIGDEDMNISTFDTDLTYIDLVQTQGGAPIYAYTLRHKRQSGFFIHNQQYNYVMAFDENNHRYAELNELPNLANEFVSAITVDKNDNLFLIYDHNTLHKYSSDLGVPIASNSSIGDYFDHGKYGFEIMSITADNYDNIYISVDVHDQNGEGYDRVLQFDNDLNFIRSLGGNFTFNGPCGIAFDSANNMYVASRWQNAVKIFDTDFSFLAMNRVSDSPRQSEGELGEPIGICINNDKVYITEKAMHRISIFTAYN